MGKRGSNGCRTAAAVNHQLLKLLVFLYILLIVIIQEVKLLQLLRVQVLAFQHFGGFAATGCDRQHGELSEINNGMAKVYGLCVLMVENDIQIYVTLILITLGNLELYTGLCFCIFGYPLFYQRTGETRCFHVAHTARCGSILLSPNVADVDTQ